MDLASQHVDTSPWMKLSKEEPRRNGDLDRPIPASQEEMEGPPLPEVITDTGHLRRFYPKVCKRVLDLLIVAVVLPAFLLLLPVVALLIRRDSPGPVFFRQTRVGRNGRPFDVWKFRTMQHTAGDGFALVRDRDGTLRHKVAGDPRVTSVGRWLRRTSLDELPQIINVLLGHMSVVGPRPELPRIVTGYQQWQHQRHLVKPGLTGWWQVNGRSERPMHENTELDLYYVARLSWALDILILLRTVRFVVRGTGAF
jgi:lipopolysaccharide/colanic/teichoic acid biosynthesis glycosyltransferase